MSADHGRPAPRDHGDSGPSDETKGPAAPAPSHAERCRTLVAGLRAGALATIAREPAGFPYASLVTVAFDRAGRPLLLLSRMAEHTQNLEHREDASLLLTEPTERHAQPLALGRVTLLGPCRPVPEADREGVRSAFLAVQPDASYYVDFKDFGFYRLEPIALRYIGGFGRMSWVTAADYLAAEPDPLAASAAEILAHMNQDHGKAVLAIAQALAGLTTATEATMTAVDRYGFELAAKTPAGPKAGRIGFEAPVVTTDEVRKALISLVGTARAKLR